MSRLRPFTSIDFPYYVVSGFYSGSLDILLWEMYIEYLSILYPLPLHSDQPEAHGLTVCTLWPLLCYEVCWPVSAMFLWALLSVTGLLSWWRCPRAGSNPAPGATQNNQFIPLIPTR